jgi:hypothetical protein
MAQEAKAIIFDGLTGEVIERELNGEEAAQIAQSKLDSESLLAEIQAKETARTSALSKLAALGLTEAEIAAL